MIAALYVAANGSYAGLAGVDAWTELRDARLYRGPWPVVAHPPCQRWGKMWFGQPLTVKRTGERKIKGDDGGCFEAALAAAREWGGVLEHPWGSHAWAHFGLNMPPREGGWVVADFHGGWTCCVEQGRYARRNMTLLLSPAWASSAQSVLAKWAPAVAARTAHLGSARQPRSVNSSFRSRAVRGSLRTTGGMRRHDRARMEIACGPRDQFQMGST